MEHVVAYRIKAIDDITPVQRKVNTLNKQSQTEFNRLGQKIDHVNSPTRRLLGNLRMVGTQGVKAPGALMAGFGKLNSFISGPMLATMGGVFAVGKIAQFGNSVVDTLSKFERFEAVLTNTLGANSAAKQVMQDITDLAIKTPFEVDQLTDAWVRLANQGFKPTMQEMTQLGDLASSTGKDISMLSEAVLDASVGENERLKEFGIQAKQHGDKVRFTFKGVTTEVDRNAKSIQQYLLSLGQLKGVQGAMAAISKTTGGQLSNLSDQYTQLKLTIGKGLKPVIEGTIAFISKLIERFTVHAKWLQNNEDLVKRFTTNALTKLWMFVEKIGNGIGAMITFWQQNGATIMEFWGIIMKVVPPIVSLIMEISKVVMFLYKIFYQLFVLSTKGFVDLWKTVEGFFGKAKQETSDWNSHIDNNDPFAWTTDATDSKLPGLNNALDESGKKVDTYLSKWDKVAQFDWKGPLGTLMKLYDAIFNPDAAPTNKVAERASRGKNYASVGFKSPFDNGMLSGSSNQYTPGISNRYGDAAKAFGFSDANTDPNATTSGVDATAPGSGKTLSQRATDVKGVVSGEIKHITINIQKLVETLMIKTEKLGMNDNQIKTHFTRLLLDAVNDTQQSN